LVARELEVEGKQSLCVSATQIHLHINLWA